MIEDARAFIGGRTDVFTIVDLISRGRDLLIYEFELAREVEQVKLDPVFATL